MLRYDTDHISDRARVCRSVYTIDLELSGSHGGQPAHHPQRAGLAGTVSTEDTEGLAALDRERNSVNRAEVAELFHKFCGTHHRFTV